MENMPRSCVEGTQLASKNMKSVEHFVRLPNEDHVELMKCIKPCAVKLYVLQATQNFKIRCLIHNRYRCRCINRNKRNVKCKFSCSGCSVQNEEIKDKEIQFRCKTTKINTSQSKQKKKNKSLNCINREFSKDSYSPNKKVCVYSTSNIIQEISNDSSSRPLYSHNFNRDKILKPEKCCPASHNDKLAGVFVDVGNDFEGLDYLLEEDNDSFKVSCETLFADNKDIDYNLVKNVKIESYVEDTSKANEINVQNLNAAVFNSCEIYTNGDWPGWLTNANVENVCDNFDSYDNITNVSNGYTTTSIVGSGSGGFREVNVKEEETIKDVLVHQSTENIIPKFKIDMVNNEELSIINESIIDTKLHAVNKMERQPEININNSRFLDKINKTEFIVLKTVSSDFQGDCTECSDEAPDNSNVDNAMVCKPLKFQNEMQTQNRTCSEHQITAKANSRDLVTTKTREECVNRLSRTDENMEMKSKNDVIYHYERNEKSEYCRNYVTYRYERNEKSEYCRHYVCEVCDKSFISINSLNIHKRLHTGDRLVVCDVCQKPFTRLDYLEIHKHIHTGEKPFACTICGKAFTRLSDFHRHNQTHTKPYVCNFCDAQFSELSSLRKHKQRHTEDRPFGCSVCRKEFAHLPSLEKHKCKLTDERPFECNVCGKTFKRSDHLKEHKRIHTGEKPFACSTCGKAFTRLSDFHRHNRTHTKPYVCNFCNAQFSELSSLRKHKQRHADNRPFGCSVHRKKFAHLPSLEKHKYKLTDERPFECNVCGKTFKRPGHLKEHKRIHTGEKPFACSTCGKAFKRLSDFYRHNRTHTKPFVCNFCDAQFSELRHLRKHKQRRTENRPFGCSIRRKKFAHLPSLEKHKCKLTGKRPFECNVCGVAFRRSSHLKVHERIHTGERPFFVV